MKNMFPTIYLIDIGDGSPHVSIYITINGDGVSARMSAERFKRLILHPRNKLGLHFSDFPNFVDTGYELVGVCSNWVADALKQQPEDVERIFKHCFLNFAPELAGLEIKDAEIKVYHGTETQDADAQ